MTPSQRLVSWLTRGRAFGWIGRRVLTPLDRALRHSRLAPARLGLSLPVCHLTTTGRRTGRPRTTPLLYVVADDGGFVVVATNWGGEAHPGWSANLEARPEALLEVDGTAMAVTARRARGEEFDRYWSRFVAMWPNYGRYRARVEREIRMYVLEPQPT